MAKENSKIIFQVSEFVRNYLSEHLPEWAKYHSLDHTVETVEGCEIIGTGCGMNENDMEILIISAWFHDTGYLINAEAHEESGVKLARDFLRNYDYPNEKIDKIIMCILATKITYEPINLMEKIIRDADLISLGKKDFSIKNDFLKEETELRTNQIISDLVWLERSIIFLTGHDFHTDYAKNKFNPQKQINLTELKKEFDKYKNI